MSESVMTLDEARAVAGQWIDANEELPPIGVYVLARHERGNWRDADDQEGVNYVVVKRQECRADRSPDNNIRNYEWKTFGRGTCFWGQTIRTWMYFPRIEG